MLFKDVDSIAPGADGNVVQAFRSRYFTAMKMAPDLAANISKMNGLPICSMTSQTYVAPSGLEGQSGKAVLDGLKAEIQKLVAARSPRTSTTCRSAPRERASTGRWARRASGRDGLAGTEGGARAERRRSAPTFSEQL